MENKRALVLMRKALALYDQDGEHTTTAACHLQAAIDAAIGAKRLQPGEEIDPDVLEAFAARVRPPLDTQGSL
ncbi:hypothetical protein PQ455_19485 (plasmid) [Sphingomonas naphthae]|uniref:Uncharacterized protein n=1 Tax=Sphingomonas naphthae TaxID=1813468 RepID=A0ABY7TRF7_9SPHN|nr:hypothetical protein [Sphingomonas naphthae]WCT75540.1 hypothetical protein PQ455_19485 [Sphingomonas naphthae]